MSTAPVPPTAILGIDTGGTFTDAVAIRSDDHAVLAAVKVPTDHADLASSVHAAMSAVLDAADVTPAEIGLVSVSTTLATNALVEGTGEPAGLITLGFGASELEAAGLGAALGPVDHHLRCDGGGHDAYGNERDGLDEALAQIRQMVAGTATEARRGWAVSSQFSVRNPAHELAVRDTLRELGVRSVTCSHELSARLGGPRRSVTALLNARLIGLVGELLDAVEGNAVALGVDAPVMVVRGDGSLVSASFARDRPIETILSGPAASVVGALHLSGLTDALISDIGGTTTDIAYVRDGTPVHGAEGAIVGAHRTMVEAVDMRTFGLGGDSEVRIDPNHRPIPLTIGPRRALPLARLAGAAPEHTHSLLDQAILSQTLSASDGRLLVARRAPDVAPTDVREQEILQAVSEGPVRERDAAGNSMKQLALDRLRRRGLVQVATMTPTDAAVLLGRYRDGMAPADALDHDAVDRDALDRDAAEKAATLLARQQDERGARIAETPEHLATLVADALVDASARCVLSAALAWDDLPAAAATDAALIDRVLDQRSGRTEGERLVQVGIDVGVPLVAVGASAATWYPDVAAALGTELVVPDHAEVANAVGAAVAEVTVRGQVVITQPRKGQFRVHVDGQPTLATLEQAQASASEHLQTQLLRDAELAGAVAPILTHEWDVVTALVGGRDVFVEATLLAAASGPPRRQS